jgi:hypothetical protein
MKLNMLKKCLFAPALLGLTLAADAATSPVTYYVDMSVQSALGNFLPDSGDTVLVSGNWDNWSLTNVLSATPTNGIYAITLAQTDWSWPNYQFVLKKAAGNVWENSVGNRWFQVPSGGTNLPVVYFNNMNGAATNSVIFQVDMSVQTTLGNFTPGSDFVTVAGSTLNNWDNTTYVLTQQEGTTNYAGTFDVVSQIGATNYYKFTIGGTKWENDGVGEGGAKNRFFVFPSGSTNLPLVFFNNVSNVVSVVTNPVTFWINMSAQSALGNFTPGSDVVTVAASALSDWDATLFVLTNTTSNPYLYANTFNVGGTVGSAVTYKFTINGGLVWENAIYNRSFIHTNVALDLPTVYFDDASSLGTLSMGPISGGQATLSWTTATNANNLIRLQTRTNLAVGAWEDVAGSLGQSSATVNVGTTPAFFRLIGP